MPVYSDGRYVHELEWDRVIGSIPATYTIFKHPTSGTYYAECNLPTGTDYSGTSATTVIQNACATGRKLYFKQGTYPVTSIALSSDMIVDGERGAWIQATGAYHPFDVNGINNVAIRNLGIDGMGIAGTYGIYIRGASYNIDVANVYAKRLRNGVYATGTPSRLRIVNSTFHDMLKDGVDLEAATTDFIINGCTCYSNAYMGIEMIGVSKGTVSHNICYSNAYSGIFGDPDFVTIKGNVSRNNTQHGIYLAASATGNAITNNECYANTLTGIHLNPALHGTINSNVCHDNGTNGILLDPGSHYNIVNGNNIHNNVQTGLLLVTSSYNNLVGNHAHDNDSGDTDTYVGIGLSTNADHNHIRGNYCYGPTQWRGLVVGSSDCEDNLIVGNLLQGNKTLGGADATVAHTVGYGNTWNRMVVPFVDGTVCEDSGWDIDLGGEYARAFAFTPWELANIIRITIYARSMVLEADAMRLEIVMNSGLRNEAYNAEAISVADKPSSETNFAADDIIYWVITSADDADIADIGAGESLEIKVLHEAAGGADCATDARFRTVEIEWA